MESKQLASFNYRRRIRARRGDVGELPQIGLLDDGNFQLKGRPPPAGTCAPPPSSREVLAQRLQGTGLVVEERCALAVLSRPFGSFHQKLSWSFSFRGAGEAKLRGMGVTDEDILRRAVVITARVVRGTMNYTVHAKEPGGEPVAVSFGHLKASPAPSPDLRLSPDLGIVYVLREGPMRLSRAQRDQLVGIGGAEAEAALAAFGDAEWSPLLILEFTSIGAAEGFGLSTKEELQERWRSHAEAMKAMMDTGVEGQGRGFATSSTVSERLWCAFFDPPRRPDEP